jgi:flagellar biosynthesis GTPase FlhF
MEKNCSYCGAHFTAQRDSRKYCTDNCKQMAYFKRNGLILSGGLEIGSVKYETPVIVKENTVKYIAPIPDVKYERVLSNVKQEIKSDALKTDQQTIDTIVSRITIAMERKIVQEMEKVKQELTVKYDSLIVKPDFTVGERVQEKKQFCVPLQFTGVQRQISNNQPKENCNPSESVIVKYSSLTENTLPEIKYDQMEHFTLAKTKEPEFTITQQEEEEEEQEEQEQKEAEETEQENENQKELPEKVHFIELSEEEGEQEEEKQEQEQEKEEPQYKWIEPKIIKRIETSYEDNKEFLFKEPLRYWGVTLTLNVNWISERLLCLTESLIKLSNYNRIDKHTLFCITDAFNRLIKSNAFKNLPDNYPNTELIKELCIKLNRLLQENEYSDQIKFCLSLDLKSRLISTRYEMLKYFPQSKFSELDFTEEKDFKQQENENEKQPSKKGWQLRYEEMKRKQLREVA